MGLFGIERGKQKKQQQQQQLSLSLSNMVVGGWGWGPLPRDLNKGWIYYCMCGAFFLKAFFA